MRDGKLRIDVCDNRCPRNYRLRIEIQSPRVPDVAIAGGGKIHASGGFPSQREVAVAVDGGGNIDLRSIDATHVTAAVNGGGHIAVRPRSRLTAAVNGGGDIRYWGDPQVTMAVHGGGTVRASLLKLGDLDAIPVELQARGQQRPEHIVAARARVEGVEEQLRLAG